MMDSERLVLTVFAAFVLLLMLLGSLREGRATRAKRQFFIALLMMTVIMLVTHVVAGVFPDRTLANSIASCAAYASFYTTLVFCTFYFTAHVAEKARISYLYAKISIPICAVFTVGWCVSAFDGVLFSSLMPTGVFSPVYWIGQMGGYIVFILILAIIFQNCRALGVADTLALLSFVVLPVISLFLRYSYGFISIDLAIALSEILIYVFINMKQTEEIYEQQLLIEKYKLSFLYNQIRPHFIFNVLNSIYILCAKDASIAQSAIEKFSEYLRMNLVLWEGDSVIPIEDELKLVKNYLELEKLRYGDELRVTYNIQATDFIIPSFTLQPIVENAVKHGIMPKKGGGTIAISTFLKENWCCVAITDDGVGFSLDWDDEKNGVQIGISNVRKRLNLLCSGTVEISDRDGGGSCVEIRIPRTYRAGEVHGEHEDFGC
ncbi:MAG: histidine kinase [Treponema sp.]|nr:histidine kinase [Treponema sp.]